MEGVRDRYRMTHVVNPDQVRLTVLYLRLWKICDAEFYNDSKHDSAKHFDVLPIDSLRLRNELSRVASSSLEWVNDPKEVRDEIVQTLDLIAASQKDRSEKNLAALDILRTSFQKKAFDAAGGIQLASEAQR